MCMFLFWIKRTDKMLKQYKLRFYNFRLIIFLLAISLIGVTLVGTAAENLKSKQFVGVILGLIIMVILSLMDYSWIMNFQWFMYGFNIIMLIVVRIAGSSANGAARWIGIGSFRFQPTELSKIILIVFFAKFFMDHEENLNTLKTLGCFCRITGCSSYTYPGTAGFKKYPYCYRDLLYDDIYCRSKL